LKATGEDVRGGISPLRTHDLTSSSKGSVSPVVSSYISALQTVMPLVFPLFFCNAAPDFFSLFLNVALCVRKWHTDTVFSAATRHRPRLRRRQSLCFLKNIWNTLSQMYVFLITSKANNNIHLRFLYHSYVNVRSQRNVDLRSSLYSYKVTDTEHGSVTDSLPASLV
jgi:hypothetical protein